MVEDQQAKVRLSLDVSPELNEVLERMAKDSHTTKSDVLRKAIALMQIVVEAKDKGQRLWISKEPPITVYQAGQLAERLGEDFPEAASIFSPEVGVVGASWSGDPEESEYYGGTIEVVGIP